MGQVENDMVLGTSSYKRGGRATEFAGRDKGIGYIAGHADDVQVVKTCYIDAVQADEIGRRARALREAAAHLGRTTHLGLGEAAIACLGTELPCDTRSTDGSWLDPRGRPGNAAVHGDRQVRWRARALVLSRRDRNHRGRPRCRDLGHRD